MSVSWNLFKMTQRSSENQEKHFERVATAEKGGMSSESSNKPFFTRNVIIATVGVIVAALVGVMILVHVTSKAVEVNELSDNSTKTKSNAKGNKSIPTIDQSKEKTSTNGVNVSKILDNGTGSIHVSNEEGTSSNTPKPQVEVASSIELSLIPVFENDSIHVVPNDGTNSVATADQSNEITPQVTEIGVADEKNDEKSTTSANVSGPDRIFFIAKAINENGMLAEEIQSILADNSQLLSHIIFRTNEIFPVIAFNNEAQSFAYSILIDGQPRIVLQDWNSNSKKLFDLTGNTPSFSADGSKIVFAHHRHHERKQFLIVSKNGDVLKRVNLTKDFGRAGIPMFSHDGNSLLFLNSDDNYSTAVHKINIDGNLKVDKICDMDDRNFAFLVSPLSDKIIRVHRRTLNNPTTKFSLVDFNDMNDIQSHTIEAETKEDETFNLLSWSPSGECVYMHKKMSNDSESIVKLDLESEELSEIYKIPSFYSNFHRLRRD